MSRSRQTRLLRRFLILLILVGASGAYAWWTKPWETKPIAITVETVAPAPVQQVLAVNGQVVPGDKVDLAAPVSGQIMTVMVKEGDEVEPGAVLARIDDTIARAGLDQAEALLESAKVDADAAKAAYDRAKALGTNVSAQARDSAKFSYEAAAARVRQLSAALAQSRRQLDLYEMTTPIGGTVLTVNAEIGQVVGTSSVLFTVGDLTAPLVETDIDEIYGARMRRGLEARVAPVGTLDSMAAHVSFLSPTVNRDTGGRTVRLGFDTAPEVPLPSGLTMSVNIVVDTYDSAITVPRSAIRDLESAPHVMLDVNGVATKGPISVRPWPAERLIVTDGLAAGDRVITDPQDVPEGAPVATGEPG